MKVSEAPTESIDGFTTRRLGDLVTDVPLVWMKWCCSTAGTERRMKHPSRGTKCYSGGEAPPSGAAKRRQGSRDWIHRVDILRL